jgi:hypothetical protein
MAAQAKKTDASPAVDKVQAFIDELSVQSDNPRIISGMVKWAADRPDGLFFAHVGDCENWVFISKLAMKAIHRTGHMRCKGHSHVVADIELEVPEDNAVAETFAQVADIHRTRLEQVVNASSMSAGASPCGPGLQWRQNQDGSWGCVPIPL